MLEKKNQHVLVTGPSGAGKSTLAKQLAAERGMPLARIDQSPSWNAMFANDPEDKHMVPGTPENTAYQTLRRRLAAAFMRRRTPSVIEGTQLLTLSPERIAGHEMHLIAPPRDVVLDRRWNRLSTNSKNVHRADDPAWRADKYRVANALYDDAAPDIARLREIPGIHIKESAYRVLDDLKKAKFESDRGNYRAKHHILSRLLSEWPDDFVQDSTARDMAGLTHVPTGFKIHAPARMVRSQAAMPAPATGTDPAAMHRIRSLLGQLAMEAEKRKYNLFAFAEDRANPDVGAEVSRVVDHPDSVVRRHQALHRQWAKQQGLADHTWDPATVVERSVDPKLWASLGGKPGQGTLKTPMDEPAMVELAKRLKPGMYVDNGKGIAFSGGRFFPTMSSEARAHGLTTGVPEQDLPEAMFGKTATKEKPYRDRVEMYGVHPSGKILGGLYSHDRSFGTFGGGIDPGEDPAAAGAREYLEESGRRIHDPVLLDVPPVIHEWQPPYDTPWQAERAKQFRGSRTVYAAGRLGDEPPVSADDPGNLQRVGLRNIASAIRRIKTHGLPRGLPMHPGRIAALEALSRHPLVTGEKAAAQAFTYVPTALRDQVLQEGLYSSKALLRRPDIHAAIAKARGEDLGKWQSDIKERLKGWKPESSMGPSVFFQGHEPPDLDALPASHPLKQWDLSKINIDLESILKRRKSTRVHGSELIPYNEADAEADPEGYVHKRHHDLTSREMGELAARPAKDVWSHYTDSGRGLYAGNVPHASVITRGGVIPPRYLKAASYRRRPGRIPLCMIKIALEPDQVRLNQFLGDEAQARRDRVSWPQWGMNRVQDAGDVFGRAGYAMQGGLYGGLGAGMGAIGSAPRVAQAAGIPVPRNVVEAGNAFADTGWEGMRAGGNDIKDYLNNPVMPKGNVNEMNKANRDMLDASGHSGQAGLANVADWTGYGATQALPSVLTGVGVGWGLDKVPGLRAGLTQGLEHANKAIGPALSYGTEAAETLAPRAMQMARAVAPRVKPLWDFGSNVAKGWFGHGATEPINVGRSFVPRAANTVWEGVKGNIPMPTPQLYADTKERAQNALGMGAEGEPAAAPATSPAAPPSRPMTMAANQPAPMAQGPTVEAQRRPAPAPVATPSPRPAAATVAPPPRLAPPPVTPPPRPAPPPQRPFPPPGGFSLPGGSSPSFRGGLPLSTPSMKAAGLFPRMGSRVQQGHAAILRPAGMAVHTEPVTKTADLLPWVSLQPQQKRVAKRVREGQNLLVYHGLGSGKSLASLAAAEGVGGPYTAIVPASLRPNYEKEIDKFTDKKSPAEVMSYTGVGMGKQPTETPNTVILDEAQRIRNPDSAGSRAAMEMAMHAPHRVLLSGTPIVNAPSDLAVPLSILRGEEMSPAKFNQQFVGTKTVNPGWMGWFQGIQPAKVRTLQNEDDLEKMLAGHVDYQPSRTPEGVKTLDERVEVDLSPEQQDFYKLLWGKLPWMMRWKLSNDYPLSKDEIAHLSSFMTGPRQAALSLYPFHSSHDPMRAFQTSSKLQSAMGSLKETLAKDPRAKALVYSNFIGAGLTPYGAALKAEGIPFGQFHGTMSEEDRKRALDDYNEGRSRVLLLGPAAAEGISARGTQLIQLLDPHWNEARLGQARGRGLRFDSHEGLPPELRDVRIQRFVSKMPPPGWLGRLFGDTARPSADEILEQQSQRKEELNEQFREVLRRVGSPGYEQPWRLFG